MPENSTLQITELDFRAIKQGFIDYMRQQDQFKDFDFEGSNINLLIDVLAYNTYIGSFYNNMAISESFLDSAQRWDSVASHVKPLNYLPRSFHSAEALIDFSITLDSTDIELPNSISLPIHSPFTTKTGSNNYTFHTTNSHILTITNREFNKVTYGKYNIPISEGIIINEYYVVDANVYQKFTISNYDIDIDTLIVTVRDNENSNNRVTYTRANSLFGHNSESLIYFLEPARGQKYDLSFGNGVVGKLPIQGNIIELRYFKSVGSLANGAKRFTYSGENVMGYVGEVNSHTKSPAQGGSEHENIDSIKFFAPKSIQIQERVITDDDMEIMMLQTFPEIEAISSFNGAKLNPPEYGKFILSIDLKNADGISQVKIDEFTKFLSKRIPTTSRIKIINPDFTFIKADIKLNTDPRLTSVSLEQVQSNVLDRIEEFGVQNLNRFKTQLQYSQLIQVIDNVDPSIISNETDITLIKRLIPVFNVPITLNLDYQNSLNREFINLNNINLETIKPAIISTGFTVNGKNSFIMDDGAGDIHLLSTENSVTRIELSNIGAVDYTNGIVNITITPEFYNNGINVIARPVSNNVKVEKNTILSLQTQNINITSQNI